MSPAAGIATGERRLSPLARIAAFSALALFVGGGANVIAKIRKRPSSQPQVRTPPAVVWRRAIASAVVPTAVVATPSCPADMVVVEGQHCTKADQRCLRWLDDEKLPFARCGTYAKPVRCLAARIPMHFCIDRYEYARAGESLPENGASFSGAGRVCTGLGKRLCTESEWNFACEGEEMRPYPYGFTREPVCNQDRPNLVQQTSAGQVLRDLREPSNARPACVSPFGVYDMVGNLDEPVVRDHAVKDSRFRCALKGGWWMPARNRCRPATTAHDNFFKGLQIGIRCCSNIVQ